MMMALDVRSQHDVRFGNRADAAVDHAHAHFVVGQLFERLTHRFDRALHVRLDDDIQILDLTRRNLAEQIVQCGLLLSP